MTMADDHKLIVFLSSSASLDASPKKNWVENGGGLPPYVRKIARGVMKSGKSKSSAIAIAISRIKVWAGGGGGVDAGTKAKAAKALAAWEALKASHGGGKLVKATNDLGTEYVFLSNMPFNTERVRDAWNDLQQSIRKAARLAKAAEMGLDEYSNLVADEVPYSYIRELWTDHIIAEVDSYGSPRQIIRVEFEVSDDSVIFSDPKEVKMEYVEVEEEDDLTEFEAALLGDLLKLSNPVDRISALAAKL